MDEAQILLSGVVFGESRRWHAGRLWFADRGRVKWSPSTSPDTARSPRG